MGAFSCVRLVQEEIAHCWLMHKEAWHELDLKTPELDQNNPVLTQSLSLEPSGMTKTWAMGAGS